MDFNSATDFNIATVFNHNGASATVFNHNGAILLREYCIVSRYFYIFDSNSFEMGSCLAISAHFSTEGRGPNHPVETARRGGLGAEPLDARDH